MTMLKDPSKKYRPAITLNLPDRTWPSRTITKAPIWCSSDLRDGNQSLIEPMDTEKKLRLFNTLVGIGMKQIEVAFPSASQTEHDFARHLIDNHLIPDDVTVQVLTQSREELISETFRIMNGARRVIVHLYNATSPVFREVVFNQDRQGVIDIAVKGAKLFNKYAALYPDTEWVFQYSPETFSATEPDFAVEVCNAVLDVWQPTPQNKAILNLPGTVECTTPNVYADQVEWFSRHVNRRDSVLISLHCHNDRGTGIAATELALMAGADRVEGCLFNNGERTGNVDLVTLALNLYVQGVNPQLDFSDIDRMRKVVEECNQLPVHPRHPYVGDLVHTAFSGSHQDAIRKGLSRHKEGDFWEVPYLPIDPADIGRDYEAVIRVNSQSGKGGITFLLERDYGISLPRRMQIEFSRVVQKEMDRLGQEMSAEQIYALLQQEYMQRTEPYRLNGHRLQEENSVSTVTLDVQADGKAQQWQGNGPGPLEAMVNALPVKVEIMDYSEHAIGAGAGAKAAAFVEARTPGGKAVFGLGIDANITAASFRALLSAVNRAIALEDASRQRA